MADLQLAFPEFLSLWKATRQRARTDLLFLCNEILGYTLITRRVHGPILDALQWFPGAADRIETVEDYTSCLGGKVLFTPKVRMELLPPNPGCVANRQTLTLFPRGHAKSTVATVAHSIQWILNYPNVRILVSTATEDLGTDFIRQIRDHFIANEKLRFYFPELCPKATDGKVPELGNLSGFFIPGRDAENVMLGPGGKDKTVRLGTVGSAITGYHGDVFKSDDLVEKINSSSQTGIDDVIRHFGAMGDLLDAYVTAEGPRPGWHDVIGTPWDFSDLYQVIRNDEEKRAADGLDPMWTLVIRSAAPNWPEGPYLWPEKVGFTELKRIEQDPTKGAAQLSAQYLMNPIVLGQGLIDDIKLLKYVALPDLHSRLPRLTLRARMDPAGMEINAKGTNNDYTCLTVGAFDDGSLLVPYVRYGRPTPEQAVEWIFELFDMFPQVVELVVEQAAGGSTLETWLRREMSSRRWLPVRFEKRSNRESKVTRIKSLRPWFMNGRIEMSSSIDARTLIEAEIKGFPKYRHDDFLDTLSDLMRDSSGGVSAGVLVDAANDPRMVTGYDPISLLLERESFEAMIGSGGGFDRDTGHPL